MVLGMSDPRPASPEPTVGEQLGLGHLFAPVPASFRLHKLATDAGSVHVVVFTSATGVHGIVLSDEALRELGRQATESSTGLTLPLNGGHRGG
jgi:hypothetical protein